MEVTKSIKLNIEKKGSNFIVKDSIGVSMLLGTASALSNLHMYNAKKEGNVWKNPELLKGETK